MRRSAELVAAGLWLLVGCGGSNPGAKAPLDPTHQPKSARGSFVSLASKSSAPATIRPQTTQPPAPERPVGKETSPTSEQLAGRFGNRRALSVQQGRASYYSDVFAGRSTASGVPYEPQQFTAAHRSLPFGSVLRVTRRDGGQVVYVRVTDRGPFARGRIVDLSRAAAEHLGMMRAGVVKVKVEVVEYGPPKRRRRRR
jgi:rare lipoprotein A